MSLVKEKLLDILVCPKCRHSVSQQANTVVCSNGGCGLRYPIRDGVPVMLIEEAGQAGTEPLPDRTTPMVSA